MKKLIFLLIALFTFSMAEARPPQKGYRGFVDWTSDLRSYDPGSNKARKTICMTGLSTSHGYQFNDWLYTGLGFDFELNSTTGEHIIAPFIHGRADLKFGKFTPFGEIRLGYIITPAGNAYFSPNIGYRFDLGRKVGLNVGAGISVMGYKHRIYTITEIEPGGFDTDYRDETRAHVYFNFRVGIDF